MTARVMSSRASSSLFALFPALECDIPVTLKESTRRLFDQRMPVTVRSTLFEDYYWPLFCYLRDKLSQHRQTGNIRPLVVGLSAPQGCGKTSVTSLLSAFFACDSVLSPAKQIQCISMSLDDFYLCGADQDRLADEHVANPLLKFRGNAGTHDLPLLNSTLEKLLQLNDAPGLQCDIPRYDKTLRGGRGDRASSSEWSPLVGPVDVVLLEGWMLGFGPISNPLQLNERLSHIRRTSYIQKLFGQDEARLLQSLQEIDRCIEQYAHMLDKFVDSWVVIALQDASARVVYQWRLQAEHAAKDQGRSCLTDEQVEDFVDRFMPAYGIYLSDLYARGPCRPNRQSASLKITVSNDRSPVSFEIV